MFPKSATLSTDRVDSAENEQASKALDLRSKCFFRFAKFLLKSSQQFIILSFSKCEIIVS